MARDNESLSGVLMDIHSSSINDFKRNIDDYYYPQSLDYNLFI